MVTLRNFPKASSNFSKSSDICTDVDNCMVIASVFTMMTCVSTDENTARYCVLWFHYHVAPLNLPRFGVVSFIPLDLALILT